MTPPKKKKMTINWVFLGIPHCQTPTDLLKHDVSAPWARPLPRFVARFGAGTTQLWLGSWPWGNMKTGTGMVMINYDILTIIEK